MDMREHLRGFRLACLRVHFVPQQRVSFPHFTGSALRGGFGRALRQTSCTVRAAKCGDCLLRYRCVYFRFFETPISGEDTRFAGQTRAPHPFILEPPPDGARVYEPGEDLHFGLTLVGQAIEYTPNFIHAFSELGVLGIGQRIDGQRGKCVLDRMEALSEPSGQTTEVIFSLARAGFCGKPSALDVDAIVNGAARCCAVGGRNDCGDDPEDRIWVKFVTPTRIVLGGRLQDTIDFELLMRNVLRRISTLAHFHCGFEPALDYKGLVERAAAVTTEGSDLTWVEQARYSRRQDARLLMGGFKGRVRFRGEMREFLPLLLLGEYLHVGKATAFGMGKYRLDPGGAAPRGTV